MAPALGAAAPAAQRLRTPASRAGRSAARMAVRPRAVASAPAPSATAWSPESWRTKKALQMPEYADPKALQDALAELRRSPPLIFAGEVCGGRACAAVARGAGSGRQAAGRAVSATLCWPAAARDPGGGAPRGAGSRAGWRCMACWPAVAPRPPPASRQSGQCRTR
jgi:hypothetical protein